jgi:hypothetical protein
MIGDHMQQYWTSVSAADAVQMNGCLSTSVEKQNRTFGWRRHLLVLFPAGIRPEHGVLLYYDSETSPSPRKIIRLSSILAVESASKQFTLVWCENPSNRTVQTRRTFRTEHVEDTATWADAIDGAHQLVELLSVSDNSSDVSPDQTDLERLIEMGFEKSLAWQALALSLPPAQHRTLEDALEHITAAQQCTSPSRQPRRAFFPKLPMLLFMAAVLVATIGLNWVNDYFTEKQHQSRAYFASLLATVVPKQETKQQPVNKKTVMEEHTRPKSNPEQLEPEEVVVESAQELLPSISTLEPSAAAAQFLEIIAHPFQCPNKRPPIVNTTFQAAVSWMNEHTTQGAFIYDYFWLLVLLMPILAISSASILSATFPSAATVLFRRVIGSRYWCQAFVCGILALIVAEESLSNYLSHSTSQPLLRWRGYHIAFAALGFGGMAAGAVEDAMCTTLATPPPRSFTRAQKAGAGFSIWVAGMSCPLMLDALLPQASEQKMKMLLSSVLLLFTGVHFLGRVLEPKAIGQNLVAASSFPVIVALHLIRTVIEHVLHPLVRFVVLAVWRICVLFARLIRSTLLPLCYQMSELCSTVCYTIFRVSNHCVQACYRWTVPHLVYLGSTCVQAFQFTSDCSWNYVLVPIGTGVSAWIVCPIYHSGVYVSVTASHIIYAISGQIVKVWRLGMNGGLYVWSGMWGIICSVTAYVWGIICSVTAYVWGIICSVTAYVWGIICSVTAYVWGIICGVAAYVWGIICSVTAYVWGIICGVTAYVWGIICGVTVYICSNYLRPGMSILMDIVKHIVHILGRVLAYFVVPLSRKYWRLIPAALALNSAYLFSRAFLQSHHNVVHQLEFALGTWAMLLVCVATIGSMMTLHALPEQYVTINASILRFVDLFLLEGVKILLSTGMHAFGILLRLLLAAVDQSIVSWARLAWRHLIPIIWDRFLRPVFQTCRQCTLTIWRSPFSSGIPSVVVLLLAIAHHAGRISLPDVHTLVGYLTPFSLTTGCYSSLSLWVARVIGSTMQVSIGVAAAVHRLFDGVYGAVIHADASSPTLAITCWVKVVLLTKTRTRVRWKAFSIPLLVFYLTVVAASALVWASVVSCFVWILLSIVVDRYETRERHRARVAFEQFERNRPTDSSAAVPDGTEQHQRNREQQHCAHQSSVIDRPSQFDEIECNICLEALDTDLSDLPCGHRFHRRCIGDWLKSPGAASRCPTCRRAIGVGWARALEIAF